MRSKLDKFLEQQKKVIEATREPGQEAGRGFHREGRGVAQEAGRRRGRLGEVHEGAALRPEQAARAGLRQRLDGQGAGRDPDRTEDGRGRLAEEVGRHRRAAGAVGLREGRGDEDEHREVAARHARPREMEPGGVAHRQGQGGPDGRVARRVGRPDRRTDGAGRGPVRRDGGRFQQRGRFARQGRGLGRDGRPDLEHERQGRDRQPAAQQPARSAAGRAKADRASRAASSSATRRSARAAARRPAGSRPIRIVKGQIKDHSKESAGGATGGGKESGKGGEGLEGPGPPQPGQRDAERLAGKQAALRNKAEGIDLQIPGDQLPPHRPEEDDRRRWRRSSAI